MDQKFIIERVIIDLVCSWRCPVNSFTDVSFIMVVYGENAFWAAGGFFRSGHLEKLSARLSSGAVSSSYNTSMEQVLLHGGRHVAPPCFYSGPEQTNQTITRSREGLSRFS